MESRVEGSNEMGVVAVVRKLYVPFLVNGECDDNLEEPKKIASSLLFVFLSLHTMGTVMNEFLASDNFFLPVFHPLAKKFPSQTRTKPETRP